MKRLSLSGDQLAKIVAIARDYKFASTGQEILYPRTDEIKLDFFIKGYSFIKGLSLNVSIDSTIQELFKEYIKQFEDFYKECISIKASLDSSIEFGKSKAYARLTDFIIKNTDIINTMLLDIYPIGRVVKQFDPEAGQVGII